MDPYKVLGLSTQRLQGAGDLDVARSRAKKLFKRYIAEKKKFDAKKVMEAFEMIKAKLKSKPGEGAYKILGRSRKERELDKHFNHQTKEIRKNKDLKHALQRAKRGESAAKGPKRIHLPGDKERIPRPRRKRRRTGSRKKEHIDALQGLRRLAAFLPERQKFPKVIKLLHRWMREYMNQDNRDFVFAVLHDITQSDFILEDPDSRQDVVEVFEYAVGYFSTWFDAPDGHVMLRQCWHVATVLACRCFTDDPFVLSATLVRLGEVLGLMEKRREQLESQPRAAGGRRAEAALARAEAATKAEDAEAKEEAAEAKAEAAEAKAESADAKAELPDAEAEPPGAPCPTAPGPEGRWAGRPALPVAPPPLARASPGPSASPPSDDDQADDVESLGSSEDVESLGSSDDEVREQPIDLGSDGDSDEVKEEEISSEPSLEGGSDSDVEMEECPAFAVPDACESLRQLRAHFVDRCLATLFHHRGPLWARPKIDGFFQDVFYRRGIFGEEQRARVEAWQARIKDLQKLGDRVLGEANNPLEAHRPVRDSREERVTLDADSNVWAAKQTFDSRDANGARGVIR